MARARRWTVRIAAALAALVLLALLLRVAGVRLTPPALLATGKVDGDAALRAFPPDTQPIEVVRPDGAVLRGMFAPAHDGAPVVLLLQEASASAGATQLGWGGLAWQLRDLGFATLVVDYGGVGLSPGERDVRNLREDALAMWGAALARAGGDPRRVVVRCTSLGSIAAALLLRSGVEPGGLIAIAPVRADTAAVHFARLFYGDAVAWFATVGYGPIADVDVPAELARAKLPVLAVTPTDDVFLGESELDAFAYAAKRPGAGHVRHAGDHVLVSCLAHRLLIEELPLLLACAGDGPPVDARLADVLGRLPTDIAAEFEEGSPPRERLRALLRYHCGEDALNAAAAALADQPPLSSARLLWLLREFGPANGESNPVAQLRSVAKLDFEPLAQLLSLEDPAGLLPIDRIEADALPSTRGPMRILASWRTLLTWSAGTPRWKVSSSIALNDRVTITLSSDEACTWSALLERGLSPADALRQTARVLLKSQGFADRVRPGAGLLDLEVWDAGGWRSLDPAAADAGPILEGTMELTGEH